jgi:hypothetical protein
MTARPARRHALALAAPVALLALALPARGDGNALPQLTPPVLSELTAIDTLPSLATLTDLLGMSLAPSSLGQIALDASIDTGVRIRAVRTMAGFCATGVCADAVATVHTDLLKIITDYEANPSPAPSELMLMRAAVETLGASNAVLPDDVPILHTLLANPSRDVRATVVHALATTCVQPALDEVLALKKIETIPQVRGELNLAEQAITSCVDN